MANVTIKQLAELVRTTPDRLKEQLKDAGVVVTSDDQTISDDEKRKLLLYLKNRRTTATPAATSNTSSQSRANRQSSVVMQGKKSVNVEVRTKRSVKASAIVISQPKTETQKTAAKTVATEETTVDTHQQKTT